MTRTSRLLVAALGVALLFLVLPAQGALFRAYLSSTGSDANPCTLPQPCRLLPAALAAVADGGEVWILDSANYNTTTVQVGKSVRIIAIPGAVGSVLTMEPWGLVIGGDIDVTLRNLRVGSMAGASSGQGITVSNGARVILEDCVVANIAGSAIVVNEGSSIVVNRSIVRDNLWVGVYILNGASGTVSHSHLIGNGTAGATAYGGKASRTSTLQIVDSTVDGNQEGVRAVATVQDATVLVGVRSSRIANNQVHGILAQADAGGGTTLAAAGNIVVDNGFHGIAAYSPGTRVWASRNVVSGNQGGLYNAQATFESAGDNAVRNNVVDVSGVVAIPRY